MRLVEVYRLIESATRPTYDGPPLESGKTSLSLEKPAPYMDRFISMGILKPGMKVLDYGAGKTARNANYLRSKGFDVIAVDPFNHNEKLKILKDVGKGDHFDAAFTSFVLNVVPEYIEDEILKKLESLADIQCHGTRGKDLLTFLENTQSCEGFTFKWMMKNIPGKGLDEELKRFSDGSFTKEDLIKLANFGFGTTSGFQRLVWLEEKGYKLIPVGDNRVYVKK
jgi:hypothetical protein